MIQQTTTNPDLFSQELTVPDYAYAVDKPEDLVQRILHVLHTNSQEEFHREIRDFMSEDECKLVESAESLGLYWQAAQVFDAVVRRLTLKFADLLNWPYTALAEVHHPGKRLSAAIFCMVLDIPKSRRLEGLIAFNASCPNTVTQKFPASVVNLLAETQHYWRWATYLEPFFHGNKVLRSVEQVERYKCRPIDPILAAYLGSGPRNYGYSWSRAKAANRALEMRENRRIMFLLAHWD